jgi:eukaryotic-like serine/threonine-protein kinase
MRRLANEDSSEGTAHVALRAAERARAAAPNAGEPLVALATYHLTMGEYATAAREVNAALRRAPSLPDVHDLCGRILVEVGRPEEGIAFLERAILLEPRMYRAKGDVIRVNALLGDWSLADALNESSPRDDAEVNYVWFLRARLAIWRADEAWASATLARMPSLSFAMAPIVSAMCALIRERKVPDVLGEMIETRGEVTGRVRRRPIFFRQLKAEACAYIGFVEGALTAIDEASSLGLIDIVWVDHCPLFDSLRTTARFLQLRAQVAERAALVLEAFT